MQKCDYEKTDKSLLNKDYKDRASDRRDKFGVDYSHIPKEVEPGLSKDNIGAKLLAKMGWKEGNIINIMNINTFNKSFINNKGEGLGKKGTGITEPIMATLKSDRSGIGSTSREIPIERLDENKKIKINNWNKTNKRFQMATLAPTPQIFSINDDDDDDVIKIDDDNA